MHSSISSTTPGAEEDQHCAQPAHPEHLFDKMFTMLLIMFWILKLLFFTKLLTCFFWILRTNDNFFSMWSADQNGQKYKKFHLFHDCDLKYGKNNELRFFKNRVEINIAADFLIGKKEHGFLTDPTILFWICSNRGMLKTPPLISSDLHFSVFKCHCRTYDDNMGPK